MIIERKEVWGILKYDTIEHRFSYTNNNGIDSIPYSREPVVLNLDLTMKCNMACRHCVAKDFKEIQDLEISGELIEYINSSPFMVVVITGGEPLLPEYESNLIRLIQEIKNKGLMIDTNGTIMPSNELINNIIEREILIRISLDSVNPWEEVYFRQAKKEMGKTQKELNIEYYKKKVKMISNLQSRGVNIAIQSVLYKRNVGSINNIPTLLNELNIKKWYIQRFIPSYKVANERNLDIPTSDYEHLISNLSEKCRLLNIECIAKKDRRHNSVFLLVGEGAMYTQGEKPGQKIPLGSYKNLRGYFDYVSCSDHSERYYG